MAASDFIPVLAIDGPSGAGKGTVSARVARQFGWHLLDSGALYRAVGHAAVTAGLDLATETQVVACARQADIVFEASADGTQTHVFVNGEDATDALRTETTGAAASTVAGYTGVREALLAKQRNMRQMPGLVADGRDMGTVVFPEAAAKVFLTASAEERAQRRYKQLKQKGLDVTLADLTEDIRARDARDAARAVAPLKPADDALVVDSTDLSIAAVVEQVSAVVKRIAAGQQ